MKSSGKRKGAAASRAPAVDPERLKLVRKRLREAIPEPRCELDHANAWQLLIATILSAQSTDKLVNEVTPELFRLYPGPAALAEAPPAEIERLVKSTGFFRNKTKSIQGASRKIVADFDGEVPRELDALVSLPGVARKTANLVLGTSFGIPTGIIVDTHAGRVARRLELTVETDPVKVERDLCDAFPRSSWVDTGHRLVLHGRYVCLARKPDCAGCPLNEACPSSESEPVGTLKARAEAERQRVESRGA